MPRGKVLIADDEVTHTEVIGHILRSAGYEIGVVRNGEAAVARATEWQPSVLILDLMMPKLNGWEVTERLKTQPETAGIPILMLTGVRRDMAAEQQHSYEPDRYLTKPFELDQLEAAVADLISSAAS